MNGKLYSNAIGIYSLKTTTTIPIIHTVSKVKNGDIKPQFSKKKTQNSVFKLVYWAMQQHGMYNCAVYKNIGVDVE